MIEIVIVLAHTDPARVRFAHSPVEELVASLRVLHDPSRQPLYRRWLTVVSPKETPWQLRSRHRLPSSSAWNPARHLADGRAHPGQRADGTLTFTGPGWFRYELDDDGRIKVNADGTISVAWWLRDEHGQWRPWMHNRFARIG